MAASWGFAIIILILLAMVVSLYNFKAGAVRQIMQYKLDMEDKTVELKRAQRGREDAESMLHKERYIMLEAEERIRSLENKMDGLEALAQRMKDAEGEFGQDE